MADKRVTLAAVAGAHGVKGEVRLKLFTDSAAGLASHKRVFIGGAEHRLTDVREGGKTAVARIKGVSDRSAAEALRGQLVEVDRADLPPLEEGEYYHADLLGLPCVDADGAEVGVVAGIENFGAGELLEIELPNGKRSLIPYSDGVADLQDGRIVLDREFLA
jgi:16S rRNA processing protein RimM